ncbi:hypothetical protein M885DRAFT_545274 [Pelagophyceae sp. CCMP2097]|nr:hypothetical protein M885DRAFT_545274 [Pelagophyceae sp. CCMP2097]
MTVPWPPRPLATRVVALAPMVRACTTPLRAQALLYGADVVYSEELIAKRVLACSRRVPRTGWVDLLDPSGSLCLRVDTDLERNRLVIQLGVADVDEACVAPAVAAGRAKPRTVGSASFAATLAVCDLCTGVDLNMGCPKPFSTQGGMGAELLKDPERAAAIVSAMRRAAPAHVAVSAKIRLRETTDDTAALCVLLARAGAAAIAVHGRLPAEEPSQTPPRRSQQFELFSQLRKSHADLFGLGGTTALLANGDFYGWDAIDAALLGESRCDGVLLARPALLDMSLFRGRNGRLGRFAVIQEYMRFAKFYDIHPVNAKYVIMEMLAKKRHPKDAFGEVQQRDGTVPRYFNIGEIGKCKTFEALVTLCGLDEEEEEDDDGDDDGDGGEPEAPLPDGRKYSDAYFDGELAADPVDAPAAERPPKRPKSDGDDASAVGAGRDDGASAVPPGTAS